MLSEHKPPLKHCLLKGQTVLLKPFTSYFKLHVKYARRITTDYPSVEPNNKQVLPGSSVT